MKTLLYIYLAISALTILLHIFTAFEARCEFKRRYPNITFPKSHLVEKMSTIFKMLICGFMPIMNIIFFCTLFFNGEKLKEETIQRLYSKHKENKDD